MEITPSKKQREVEKAIMMLVDCVRENCRNKKPLLLHSVRVGLKLLELNQPSSVVSAGILHDLLEDTNCTLEQIEKEFGKKVAGLVMALSQEKIKDYKKRWHILLKKIKKAGKQAMLIKVIDIQDNAKFLPLVKDKKILNQIYWKHNFAMSQMEPYIGNLEIFKQCRQDYLKTFRQLVVAGKGCGSVEN